MPRSTCPVPWRNFRESHMIGCTNRRADLSIPHCIPRTQPDDAAADSGRAGPARGRPPATPLGDADPTPPTYGTTTATAPDRSVGYGADRDGPRSAPARAGTSLRHRARPLGRVRCRTRPRSAPVRAGASLRHRTRLLTRSGPVPPARARGSGRDGLNLHDGHQHGSAG